MERVADVTKSPAQSAVPARTNDYDSFAEASAVENENGLLKAYREGQRPRLAPVPGQRRHARPHRKPDSERGAPAGFDIYDKASDGFNRGFAALSTGDKQRFHQVNILDGEMSLVGSCPVGRQAVDIALPLNQN